MSSNQFDEKTLEVFRLYCAIKTHFNSVGYDYTKTDGRMRNMTMKSLSNRSDGPFFHLVAGRFSSRVQLVRFFIANFVSNNKHWIGNIEKAFDVYNKWLSRMQNLSYTIGNELANIENLLIVRKKKWTDLLEIDEGVHPPLLRLYMGNFIGPETLCVLNHHLKLFDAWDPVCFPKSDDVIYSSETLKLKKYALFFDIDSLTRSCEEQLHHLIRY